MRRQIIPLGKLKEKFESIRSKDVSKDQYMVVLWDKRQSGVIKNWNSIEVVTIKRDELQNPAYLKTQFSLFSDKNGSRNIQAIYALNDESFKTASVGFAKLKFAA